jgi:hypothetical protein
VCEFFNRHFIELKTVKQCILCADVIVSVLESIANEIVDGEIPLFVLHKIDFNETTVPTENFTENSQTTEGFSTEISEKNDTTIISINATTPVNPLTASVAPTTEKNSMNESAATTLNVENSTVLNSTDSKASSATAAAITDLTTKESKTSAATTAVTTELPTTEVTTSTTVVPIDCPVLKDCPFDYCAFAHKLDHRGCPTCNCLQSTKSNITCPILTCQTCLYGHYTDSNGVYSHQHLIIFI